MKLTKIKIENYKSIQSLEFDIQKYGSSYTTMFLGVNESGKSNILEAMSFLCTPEGEFDYLSCHNQKDDDYNPVDLWFSLEFEDKSIYQDVLREDIEGGELLSFELVNVVKNVYIEEKETSFREAYSYDIKNLSSGLFVISFEKSVNDQNGQPTTVKAYKISKTKEESSEELTQEKFQECFKDKIDNIIKKHEPFVTLWKPSEKYLISTEDLNSFVNDISAKPALKNIFLLAGYDTEESIKKVVETVSNGHLRSRLSDTLQDNLDEYIKKVWHHNIDIVVDITETGKFTLSIKDVGEENRHDRLPINGRSEGARHFLSLILSLSIESEHEKRRNQLILIDEPEAHLHPSGIRDLGKELLKIGKNNYLFISTHSPFLVDKKKKERHIILKKNNSAFTEKFHIDSHSSIIDDEVLREAFGLEVYKDLLNPHSILVEGASDKILLQKAFEMKDDTKFGITNGHGSNVDTVASKLNDVDISILVVVDDDSDGKLYKKKILKIGGSYSSNNVFTIRDLVGEIVSDGTIEDTLGKGYVESKVKEFYQDHYSEDSCDISLDEISPFIVQIKQYLYMNQKVDIDAFVEELKDKLAEDFTPVKGSFSSKFPLLNSLAEKIKEKLE